MIKANVPVLLTRFRNHIAPWPPEGSWVYKSLLIKWCKKYDVELSYLVAKHLVTSCKSAWAPTKVEQAEPSKE